MTQTVNSLNNAVRALLGLYTVLGQRVGKYTFETAKRRVARLWAKEISSLHIILQLWEGNAEAYFRHFFEKKGRSIIGQDKEPPSCATAARPQSPAVRGFSAFRLGGRFLG